MPVARTWRHRAHQTRAPYYVPMDISQAGALARALMDDHGLDQWSFTFDRAKKRAGCTRFSTREISLSRHITELCSPSDVRQTILHEIAHALVGPSHNHDATWRAMCAKIGGTPSARMTNGPRIDGAWVGTCPAGHTLTRHRRPTRVASCAVCHPRSFNPAYRLSWRNIKTGETL